MTENEMVELRRPEWGERFLTALKDVGTITAAVRVAKVGRRTVYDEIARNPDFATEVRAVQDECVELVEQTLYQCAMSPSGTQDRAFYLRAMRPEKYAGLGRQQVEQIKVQARQEALREMRDEVRRLPVEARRIVLAAMDAAKKERELAGPHTNGEVGPDVE